jgi:hypothetical protein
MCRFFHDTLSKNRKIFVDACCAGDPPSCGYLFELFIVQTPLE